MDLYTDENYDIEITRGDTANILHAFIDEETGENIIIEDGLTATFTVKDPLTDEVLITKTRTDAALEEGIYFFGDSELPSGINLNTNELVVVLDWEDTEALEEGIYDYDIELKDDTSDRRSTPIKGALIITKETTQSV